MILESAPVHFLRRVLAVDGAVCVASGLVLLAVPAPIAALIGVAPAGLVAGMGASLVVWGLLLWRQARREPLRRSAVLTAVAVNAAWVIASAALVASGLLTREGNWIVALVADAVLLFAAAEAIGLRRAAGASAALGPR